MFMQPAVDIEILNSDAKYLNYYHFSITVTPCQGKLLGIPEPRCFEVTKVL